MNIKLNFKECGKKAESRLKQDEDWRESKAILVRNHIQDTHITKSTMRILTNFEDDFIFPTRGQQLRIRTQQQINLISIIIKAVDTFGGIDELVISTYTLNKEAFNVIYQLFTQGKIARLSLLVASSYSFRDKKHYAYLHKVAEKLKEKYDFHLVFAWIHLKITLMQCGDEYFLHEGSMNYSTNNMAENLIFENHKENYEQERKFLLETMLNRGLKSLEIVC